MSRIHPECSDVDPPDRSVAADVHLRQEPDEEEEEDEEEDGEQNDDEEEDDEGYSELNPLPPLHVLAGAWATKWQVVLKRRISVTEGEGRPPGRNQPRLVTCQIRCCESIR